jgi:TetR/AcrR family transcriptional repressor of multidrug resistance operon
MTDLDASTRVDRAALVRRAFLELVAERGFHGASMSSVAQRAGVAAGTIYVHYASKDELVLAVYRDVKRELGSAAVATVDSDTPPRMRFETMWRNVLAHLSADPDRARFLIQVDASPYSAPAHTDVLADRDDPLMAAASTNDMVEVLVDLPPDVLYDLGFGPAVRLAASRAGEPPLDEDELARLVEACWRAITR